MTIQAERAGEFFGVPGRFENVHIWPIDARIPERAHGKFSTQTFKSERRFYKEGGKHYAISFEARYDDNCKNGHNDFAITGEIWESTHDKRRKGREWIAGGCVHDEIAKHFPSVAHVLKWHLTGEAGPMHYAANAVYLTNDRDHRGLRKGETRQIVNGKSGLPSWELVPVNAEGERIDRDTLPAKYVDAATRPETSIRYEYRPWLNVGEGKERQLDAARSAAVWPDATDAELSVEPDELCAALVARLPALLADFRAMIDASGFNWTV